MLKKGTRIVKINSKEGDGHQDGDGGIIHGMLALPEPVENDGFISHGMYQVIWDDIPDIPVLIADYRVKDAS